MSTEQKVRDSVRVEEALGARLLDLGEVRGSSVVAALLNLLVAAARKAGMTRGHLHSLFADCIRRYPCPCAYCGGERVAVNAKGGTS